MISCPFGDPTVHIERGTVNLTGVLFLNLAHWGKAKLARELSLTPGVCERCL